MVQLRPMSQAEFEAYRTSSVRGFAQEQVRAGKWHPDQALQLAEEGFKQLLPDGVDTRDHHLFTVRAETDGKRVGILWFAVRNPEGDAEAFVYDVEIEEAYRRQGYGSQAFRALEDKVRELGLAKITLHVFGHNHAARAMYAKLGFEVVDLIMAKTLSPEG
jgi:ribosomal protein S18 acetylase RimI-like enzyme